MSSEELKLNRTQVAGWVFSIVIGLGSFLGYQINERVGDLESSNKKILEKQTTFEVEFAYLKIEVAKNSVQGDENSAQLSEPRFTEKTFESRMAATILALNSNIELDKKQMELLDEISKSLISLEYRVENIEK